MFLWGHAYTAPFIKRKDTLVFSRQNRSSFVVNGITKCARVGTRGIRSLSPRSIQIFIPGATSFFTNSAFSTVTWLQTVTQSLISSNNLASDEMCCFFALLVMGTLYVLSFLIFFHSMFPVESLGNYQYLRPWTFADSIWDLQTCRRKDFNFQYDYLNLV